MSDQNHKPRPVGRPSRLWMSLLCLIFFTTAFADATNVSLRRRLADPLQGGKDSTKEENVAKNIKDSILKPKATTEAPAQPTEESRQEPVGEQQDKLVQPEEFVVTTSEPALTRRLLIGIAIGVAAMIFTAWQMSDFPDGPYAALCRLLIRGIGGTLRILASPFRVCLSSRYAEHMPVSTMDYGYKDPSLQTSAT